jgi:signal recognition particle receptor subunit beta
MALFNYANREITAKIVYYGPGICGKTTSLQYIHQRIAPEQRGRLLSLATETDRTIFFDLLPLKLGEIRGFKLRFQLYTVPGQVKYNQTRKLVLQGADAIVFVADSQVSRREANLESFKNLQENLREQGKKLEDFPLVYAYNKRDLKNLLSIEELNRALNSNNFPYFPAVATEGVGVMETLEAISKLALQDMENRLITKTTMETPVEEFSITGEELLDLTGGGALSDTSSLTFSREELDTLDLESDLDVLGSSGKSLETKPIGYDNNIPIQEVEIREESVAHTGTLKESEFFNLKDIEEQALRELDNFIEGKTSDEPLTFDTKEEDIFTFAESPDAEKSARFDGDELDFSFVAETPEEPLGRQEEESLEISGLGTPEADTVLDFSLEDHAQPIEAEESELTFSLEEDSGKEDLTVEDSGITFDLEEKLPPPLTGEQDDLLEFSLEEESGEPVSEQHIPESPTKAKIDSLELSDTDFDLTLGEEQTEEPETLPSFTLPEEDVRGESTPLTTDENELVEFTLDEESQELNFGQSSVESSTKAEIESLELSESDLDLAFGEEEGKDEEAAFVRFETSEEPPDFGITDSVKFEMQHSEEISSVTPFEKQLDELSEDLFMTDETPGAEFQPETSETGEEETFQIISDESTRLTVLAKHFFQQGEIYRAEQTVNNNILAILMYYMAIETVLKAAALKYETCNPSIASLKIVLDSIEEETGKPITGKKSILDNVVQIKNDMQLETVYPDHEGCDLAARICERFLTTFSQDFLSVDFTKLSPILVKPTEKNEE